MCQTNTLPSSQQHPQLRTPALDGSQHPHFRTRVCGAFVAGRPCPAGERCFHAHGYSQLRADAAVAHGFLDPAFRTVLCHAWLAEGYCPVQERCTFAHGLQERRVDAAITLGALPRHYKTKICHAWSASLRNGDGDESCPLGHRCYFAHGVKELRVDTAIELGVLPPSFKTRICSAFANSGTCPVAERCLFAHGAHELRVEAAIALGVLPTYFKSRLCSSWVSTGGACPKGEKCYYAHGVEDLRTSSVVPGAPAVGDPNDVQPPPPAGPLPPLPPPSSAPVHRASFDGVPLSHRSQQLMYSPLREAPQFAHAPTMQPFGGMHVRVLDATPEQQQQQLQGPECDVQPARGRANHGSGDWSGSDTSGSRSSGAGGAGGGGVRTPRGQETGRGLRNNGASTESGRSASPLPSHGLNLPSAEDLDDVMMTTPTGRDSSANSSSSEAHDPASLPEGMQDDLRRMGGEWPKLPVYGRRASLDEQLVRNHSLW